MTRTFDGSLVRWLAIAAGAVLLASCRSLPVTVAPSTSATLATALVAEGEDAAGKPDRDPGTDSGLEAAVSPLPRVALASHAAPLPIAAPSASPCPDGRCGAGETAIAPDGACHGPACRRSGCGSPRCRLLHPRPRGPGACQSCEPGACGPIVPTVAIPVIGPCLVCDGGDKGKPALPRGRTGLVNVTTGDTVARYRAAGPGPAPEDEECLESAACVVASNCTCVYAPRFSSVRLVTLPFEDSVPAGPQGVALDTLVEAKSTGQAVRDKTQPLQPVAARKAQPGIAVEDRIPVLGIDTVRPPVLAEAFDGPVAHSLDQPPEKVTNVEAPRLARKIDVPMAWTCVSGAQVTVNGEAADVLAVDHGVATLRLESPGRCELTLSKRAGSDTARPGEELDFTIFVLNSGDRPLTDITLADAVPPRLEVIPGSAVSNLPADISTAAGEDGSTVVTWAFKGTLAPRAGGFVRFRTIVR